MMNDTAVPGTPLAAVMESASAASQEGGTLLEPGQTETTEEDYKIPFLEVEDNPNYQDSVKYTLELFGSGCLECKHLVQDGEVDYKVCHFSRGNAACPAKSWHIDFVGERVKWTLRVKKVQAMPKGVERNNRIMLLLEQAKEIESDDLRDFVITSIVQ